MSVRNECTSRLHLDVVHPPCLASLRLQLGNALSLQSVLHQSVLPLPPPMVRQLISGTCVSNVCSHFFLASAIQSATSHGTYTNILRGRRNQKSEICSATCNRAATSPVVSRSVLAVAYAWSASSHGLNSFGAQKDCYNVHFSGPTYSIYPRWSAD